MTACKQTRSTNRVHKLGDAGRDVVVALTPVHGRAASLEGFPHDCDFADPLFEKFRLLADR